MEPKITYRADGSLQSLEGRDAVQLMRVQTIITGIRMNIQTNGQMVLTRGATITRLLTMATEYTGQKYSSRKLADKERAITDLTVWFNNMKSTIPTETND
jgi:hypothetical protein